MSNVSPFANAVVIPIVNTISPGDCPLTKELETVADAQVKLVAEVIAALMPETISFNKASFAASVRNINEDVVPVALGFFILAIVRVIDPLAVIAWLPVVIVIT